MGQTILQQVSLETEECCNCGIIFAMPATTQRRFRDTGGLFYCPNGHSQHYTKTELMRMREKLDEQTRIATQMTDRARRAEAAEQKSAVAIRKLKKRVSGGVCPCCNRSFQSIARHMKTKHPDFS